MPSILRSLLSALCSLPLFQKHKLLCLVFLCTTVLTVNAQRPMGSWSILNTKLNMSKQWSIWGEGQLRSIQFYDEFFYYEVKGGITFNLKDHVSLTGGVGHYATYTQGGNFVKPLVTSETRTWLQVVMDQKWDRIIFEHRYRIEQRHLNTGYKNRYRYRLNVTIPINQKEVSPKTLYAYIGDEIFFHGKAPFYERNRCYAGLGYKISPLIAFQSGYMRQYDYKLTSETSRDFLAGRIILQSPSRRFS